MRLKYSDIMSITVHRGTIHDWAYSVQVKDGYTHYPVRYTSGSIHRECKRVPKCVLKYIANAKVVEELPTCKTYKVA